MRLHTRAKSAGSAAGASNAGAEGFSELLNTPSGNAKGQLIGKMESLLLTPSLNPIKNTSNLYQNQ